MRELKIEELNAIAGGTVVRDWSDFYHGVPKQPGPVFQPAGGGTVPTGVAPRLRIERAPARSNPALINVQTIPGLIVEPGAEIF